jgi:hypothetical protein
MLPHHVNQYLFLDALHQFVLILTSLIIPLQEDLWPTSERFVAAKNVLTNYALKIDGFL